MAEREERPDWFCQATTLYHQGRWLSRIACVLDFRSETKPIDHRSRCSRFRISSALLSCWNELDIGLDGVAVGGARPKRRKFGGQRAEDCTHNLDAIIMFSQSVKNNSD